MPPYPLNIDKAVETSVNSSWEQVRMNLKSLIINPEGGVCASQKKFSLLYFSFFLIVIFRGCGLVSIMTFFSQKGCCEIILMTKI